MGTYDYIVKRREEETRMELDEAETREAGNKKGRCCCQVGDRFIIWSWKHVVLLLRSMLLFLVLISQNKSLGCVKEEIMHFI